MEDKGKEKSGVLAGEAAQNERPMSLTIDWDLYGHYLEDSDLSDDQKRELIQTLWNIVVGFVDLGFGIHPVQQACEQKEEIGDFIASKAVDLLNSENTPTHEVKSADGNPLPSGGRSQK